MGKAALLDIQAEQAITTKTIVVTSNREVQQIRDKTNFQVQNITNQSKLEACELSSDANAKVEKLKADADYECAKMSALADKTIFRAEGVSAPLNRTLNDHNTSLKKFEAQLSLASNDRLVITGTSGGKAANRLIMTEATLSDASRTASTDVETTSVLSQLAVVSGTAGVHLTWWGTPGAAGGVF